MTYRDPFARSLMAKPASARLMYAVVTALLLWIAIFWAVSLP